MLVYIGIVVAIAVGGSAIGDPFARHRTDLDPAGWNTITRHAERNIGASP